LQPLNLYASIEQYLDFEEEIYYLYKTMTHIVLSKNIETLIDIGCGQGEFCNILNLNGIDTFGVDLSQTQIDIALQKNVKAKCVDIKNIKNKYDCATATFDVLNYIPKKDLKEFLSHTYNLLNKDGYFIFDINTLYGFEEIAQGTLTMDIKEENKFISIDANFEEGILYTDIVLFIKKNGLYIREDGTIKQFYHTNQILITILKEVGFVIEDIVGFNLHNENNSDKQIFICKKGDKNDF
jgi:cyclopropane fatty-acyl-phospholipid synthase-like methyltransferase